MTAATDTEPWLVVGLGNPGPEYAKMTQATKMFVGWLDMMDAAAAFWRQTPIWSPTYAAAQAWLMSYDLQRGQMLELAAKGVTGVRLSCQITCDHDMAVRAISRLAGSGRPDAGKRPADTIEPQPVEYVPAPVRAKS